jgi:hypothetical protein
MLLNQVQQDLQQNNLELPVMVHGVHVEDDVEHLQLELQVVQSRLRSDDAFIVGHVFESYEDTLESVVDNGNTEDWQYVMDIPALYSLVHPDGQ